MRQFLDRIQVSYWFVPLVAGVFGIALARVFLAVDAAAPNLTGASFGLFGSNSLAVTRTALIGISATVLATTSVVYSLLTVPMSVAASQFGSRLLRVYLKNPTAQAVLGLFVGTFTYALSLALFLPPEDGAYEVPQISAFIGLLLALSAFGSLIVLIHNIGVLLQAPNMVAAASEELRAVIRSYRPVAQNEPGAPLWVGEPREGENALITRVRAEGKPVYAEGLGYIRDINPRLADLLARHPALVVHFVRKPGDFIHPGDLIAEVWPPADATERVLLAVRRAYSLGNSRSPAQDIGYGLNQLVEVALRAMSPALNDPFTAITCLDHIGAGIGLYSEILPARGVFYDTQGKMRVIINPLTYGELLEAAFGMLRRVSRDNAQVTLHMLDTIALLGQKAGLPERRADLARQARLIEAESEAGSNIAWDQERVRRRCAEVVAELEGAASA
jgi:uncharacterized membrane protein